MTVARPLSHARRSSTRLATSGTISVTAVTAVIG
jgi:hypothetical protein